jgi:hypothetical protein
VGHGAHGPSPGGKTGLIPAKAFEHERSYLTELPPIFPRPTARTSGHGSVRLRGVRGELLLGPGQQAGDVKVLQYADRLKIYQQRTCVAEYPLPADGVKNARFSPEGQPRRGTCPSTASTAPAGGAAAAGLGRRWRPMWTTP